MEGVDRILRETLTTDAIEVKGKGEIVKSITSMERNRQDSLYVETKEERGVIKTPREVISQAMCEDLFAKIEAFLPIVETNLTDLRNIAKELIFQMIERKDEFQTHQEFLSWLDDRRLDRQIVTQ